MSASEASMDSDTQQSSEPDQATVLERLGSALREARLSRGLDRGTLAAKLHMGDEQLMALENADLSRLPEPVFVIAQSRRVADALGVDISLLIAPLKRTGTGASSSPMAAPSRNGANALLLPLPMPAAGRSGRPSRRRSRNGGGTGRFLGGAALLAGVAAAGFWAWPQLQIQRRTPVRQPSPPVVSRPKPPAPPNVLLLRASQPSWLEVHGRNHQVLFRGTFRGERRFPIGQGLRVLAGRPDLVTASLGDAAPRPLGRIDQIRWQTFQASGTSTTSGSIKAGLRTPATATPAPAP